MIDFVELGRKTNDLFFSSFHKIEDEHTLLHVQTHCCRFYFLFLIPKIFLILSQFLINKTIFFGLLFAAVSAAAFFLVIHKRTRVRRVRAVYDLLDSYQANENAQWF